MTTTTTTLANLPTGYEDMARDEMKRLRPAYKRTVTWLALCDAYSKSDKTGPAPSLRLMPSKDHKHRMYASADRVRSLLKLNIARPTKLAEIGELILAANALLSATRSPRRR